MTGLTFIDMFAGIGGFRLGMEQAGHTCVGYIEKDKYAVKSYQAMHDTKGEFYASDIRAVDPWNLPHADVFCGGFPCQSFSIAGQRRGFEDMRGTLIFEIFRLAKVRRPKILFLENVRGLLSHDNGRTFGTIISVMDELGYDAEWQCINSRNYLPQSRERVYIIGHLRGRSTRKIFPVERKGSGTLKQLVGGAQGYRVYDPSGIACTLASNAGGMGAKTGLYFIDIAKKPKITSIARAIPTKYRGITNRPAEASGVIVDTSGSQRIRRLTPKECFRLQGFHDKLFEKANQVNSDSQLYKQAGNAVTVPVIYDIAKRLEVIG